MEGKSKIATLKADPRKSLCGRAIIMGLVCIYRENIVSKAAHTLTDDAKLMKNKNSSSNNNKLSVIFITTDENFFHFSACLFSRS